MNHMILLKACTGSLTGEYALQHLIHGCDWTHMHCSAGRIQSELSSQLNGSLILAVITTLFLTRHLGITTHERDEAQASLLSILLLFPFNIGKSS